MNKVERVSECLNITSGSTIELTNPIRFCAENTKPNALAIPIFPSGFAAEEAQNTKLVESNLTTLFELDHVESDQGCSDQLVSEENKPHTMRYVESLSERSTKDVCTIEVPNPIVASVENIEKDGSGSRVRVSIDTSRSDGAAEDIIAWVVALADTDVEVKDTDHTTEALSNSR